MIVIYILVGIAVVLLISIYILWRLIRRKKKRIKFQNSPPQEIIDDFEKAEKEMKGGIYNNGETNPYSILWEIYKYRRDKDFRESGEYSKPIGNLQAAESTIDTGKLSSEHIRREELQDRTTEDSSTDVRGAETNEQSNSRRSLFRRVKSRSK